MLFRSKKNIFCVITYKLITIRNANTTLGINNEIHFEILFEKGGVSSRVTTENKKSASIFLSDSKVHGFKCEY
jgi:hypothetical protein